MKEESAGQVTGENSVSSGEMIPCRWCGIYVKSGSAYCHACGAHRNMMVVPPLEGRLAAQQRKIKVYTVLFALGVTVVYYTSIFLVPFLIEHTSWYGILVLVIAGLALLFYIGIRVEKATKGIACPACGELLNDWFLKQNVSHCYSCGTRILAGEKSRLQSCPERAESQTTESRCAYCGADVAKEHVFCRGCGSNIAVPSSRTQNYKGTPDRILRCPECRKKISGVPKSRFNYCPICGIEVGRLVLRANIFGTPKAKDWVEDKA